MKKLLPRDPESIGGFELFGRLGAGGLGVVYLASRDGVSVALKVMRESVSDDPTERERFRREIEILSGVDSPNVARIVDSGVDDETAWFATEYVNGPNLKELLETRGPVTGEEWWTFSRGLLRGLGDIHRVGVIHRDIKPANIIIENGHPRIIDFGISQMVEATSLTVTGVMTGSPAWFAPEQIDGEEITQAADLFAAGSVLTYAATGKTPWGDPGTMTRAAALRIGHGDPDLDGLSDGQAEVVRALIHPDPRQRQSIDSSKMGLSPENEPEQIADLGYRFHERRKLWKSRAVVTITAGTSVLTVSSLAVALAISGSFGDSQSAVHGLTSEALADIEGWSPAAEIEVRTVRGLTEGVRQELEDAIDAQVNACSELTEEGQFACPEFVGVMPVESLQGTIPDGNHSIETAMPERAEVICEEPMDSMSDASVIREAECIWSFSEQNTYFASVQRLVNPPEKIWCTGSTGWCDWGNGVQVYVDEILRRCQFESSGDFDPNSPPPGWGCIHFMIDCWEGVRIQGYSSAWAACRPQEISVRGSEIATVTIQRSVEGVVLVRAVLDEEKVSVLSLEREVKFSAPSRVG